MQYSNPHIPEGINTSKEHPLKEFLMLSGGVIAALFVLVTLLVFIADRLTAYIPFSVEKNIELPAELKESHKGPIVDYLQSLADRVVSAETLPDEMTITVHYVDKDTVNAFATLGGNVVVFRGLLEKLPNENALAMLMAHEIAHIKHRHPVRSLGRGVVVGLALTVISTSIGDAVLEQFMGSASLLTMLKYSREMETEADDTAIHAMKTLYGHLEGSNDLFEILHNEEGNLQPPEFLSTHPATADRIKNIDLDLQQSPSGRNTVIPLPAGFSEWIVKRAGNK